ncbi:CAF17-like 4Fe-4S cluster assembly/insertion protein YgfZ [Roseivivax sp. CAU 1761]
MTDPDRIVLRVSGEDARPFLQNLVTNDLGGLDSGLVYAALLTPQGKYRADFLLAPDGDGVLIDVAEPVADELEKALKLYKLRAKVSVERTAIAVARGTGPAPEGAFADPRHDALGWRAYDGRASEPGIDWTAIRVAHCIPEAGFELGPDSYILEAGFERLHGVDFRKGCFVGQEIVARMKHKTELRKGLASVAVEGDAAPGTPIEAEGKAVGVLHSRAGDRAIAHLRFDRVRDEMTAGAARVRPA